MHYYCYLCCRRDRCARGRAREGIACAGNRAGSLTSTMARAHNATATRSGVICGSVACNIAQEGNHHHRARQTGDARFSLTFHVHTVQKQCILCCPREPFRAYTQRHTRFPRRTHTYAHTYTRLQEVISQHSTDLAGAAPTRRAICHRRHALVHRSWRLLSRCFVPVASRLASTARRHLEGPAQERHTSLHYTTIP